MYSCKSGAAWEGERQTGGKKTQLGGNIEVAWAETARAPSSGSSGRRKRSWRRKKQSSLAQLEEEKKKREEKKNSGRWQWNSSRKIKIRSDRIDESETVPGGEEETEVEQKEIRYKSKPALGREKETAREKSHIRNNSKTAPGRENETWGGKTESELKMM